MTKNILPRLEPFTDFATYNIAGDDEECVAAAIEHIEESGITKFLAAVAADYCATEKNASLLAGWCASRGIPMTCWNLIIAFRDLTEDGQLEAAPPPEPLVDTGNPSIVLTVTDALAHYVPTDDEAATLAKLQDDPSLNDHQRKVRLRKLALLAGQQRRELSNLPMHYGAKCVI
jgi:hypothetical protein